MEHSYIKNLRDELRKKNIPQAVLEKYDRDFEIEYAHHSTAMEGNTLTLKETKAVIEGKYFLSDDRRQRYARQIIIPGIGEAGQKKLAAARVLVIGAGGLGSPAAMYLAAAGMGVIGIADGDSVELSNLQRQVIHSEASIGKNKAGSAAEFIRRLDPEVRVHIIENFLDEEGLRKIIGGYDFVLDCVDRPEVKLMINDVCVDVEKPFCHGGVRNFGGQVMTWLPGFPDLREVMGEGFGADAGGKGIIGMACGICGSLQALEAVKFITGAGRLLTGKIFVFDGLDLRFGVLGDKK